MAKRRNRRKKQLGFEFRTRGGKRAGAGRKRAAERSLVKHRRRPRFAARHPVHVTLRVRGDVPDLRGDACFEVMVGAFHKARERFWTRLVHWSVQPNHVHLIVESEGAQALAKAMQGLCVRIAHRLNRALGRHGSVFADHYAARALATPTEVRNGIAYVLHNYQRHLAQRSLLAPRGWLDPRSSAHLFDGWREARAPPHPDAVVEVATVVPARSWLLRQGWRRAGELSIHEIPGTRP